MLTYKNIRLAHALLSTAAIIMYFVYGRGFLYVVAALVLVYFGFIVYGVFTIRAGFFLKLHNESRSDNKDIALTFDDGPSEHTNKVLDILKQYNIKATFFLIGKRIKGNEEVIHRLLAEGHQMGNHTYQHSNATGFYPALKLEEELRSTNAIIDQLIGLKMRLFRPPFGVTTPNLAKVIAQLKWDVIGWSVRSLDTTAKPAEKIVRQILKQVKPGAVVLLHDDREKCATVLEAVIPRLLEQQYRFATVGELFKIEAYENH